MTREELINILPTYWKNKVESGEAHIFPNSGTLRMFHNTSIPLKVVGVIINGDECEYVYKSLIESYGVINSSGIIVENPNELSKNELLAKIPSLWKDMLGNGQAFLYRAGGFLRVKNCSKEGKVSFSEYYPIKGKIVLKTEKVLYIYRTEAEMLSVDYDWNVEVYEIEPSLIGSYLMNVNYPTVS